MSTVCNKMENKKNNHLFSFISILFILQNRNNIITMGL